VKLSQIRRYRFIIANEAKCCKFRVVSFYLNVFNFRLSNFNFVLMMIATNPSGFRINDVYDSIADLGLGGAGEGFSYDSL